MQVVLTFWNNRNRCSLIENDENGNDIHSRSLRSLVSNCIML